MKRAAKRVLLLGAALAALSLATGEANAQPQRPSAEGEQVRVAPFLRVALLELPRGAGPARADRHRGDVVFSLAGAPSTEWEAQHARRVGESRLIASSERRDDELTVRLASLRSIAQRVSTPLGGVDFLIVGELRGIEHLRRHFFGDDCVDTLPRFEDEQVQAAIVEYCERGETAPLAAIESESERPSEVRQFATALRHEALVDLASPRLDRFERLGDNGVGQLPRLVSWMALAMMHTIRDELPAALDALAGAREAAMTLHEGDAVLSSIDAFGSALFERLVRGALAAEAPLVAVYYADRYDAWERHPMQTDLVLTLGRAYRWAGLPESASRRYVQVVAAGHPHEPDVLQELSWAYLESGDTFRAVETLAYLGEQFPSVEADPLLAQLLDGEDGARPVDPCETGGGEASSAELLLALVCARRAEDLEEEARVLDVIQARAQSEEDAVLTASFADRLSAELRWRRSRASGDEVVQ